MQQSFALSTVKSSEGNVYHTNTTLPVQPSRVVLPCTIPPGVQVVSVNLKQIQLLVSVPSAYLLDPRPELPPLSVRLDSSLSP